MTLFPRIKGLGGLHIFMQWNLVNWYWNGRTPLTWSSFLSFGHTLTVAPEVSTCWTSAVLSAAVTFTRRRFRSETSLAWPWSDSTMRLTCFMKGSSGWSRAGTREARSSRRWRDASSRARTTDAWELFTPYWCWTPSGCSWYITGGRWDWC